jgi:hypothetical protein
VKRPDLDALVERAWVNRDRPLPRRFEPVRPPVARQSPPAPRSPAQASRCPQGTATGRPGPNSATPRAVSRRPAAFPVVEQPPRVEAEVVRPPRVVPSPAELLARAAARKERRRLADNLRRRLARRARGLRPPGRRPRELGPGETRCSGCHQPALPGFSRCASCLETARRGYARRKAADPEAVALARAEAYQRRRQRDSEAIRAAGREACRRWRERRRIAAEIRQGDDPAARDASRHPPVA